jgi:hypothetical protein
MKELRLLPAVLEDTAQAAQWYDGLMIEGEKELRAAQQRLERFHSWLLQFRQTALPSEFDAVASGYRLEIERMQAEILNYLLRPAKARELEQPA